MVVVAISSQFIRLRLQIYTCFSKQTTIARKNDKISVSGNPCCVHGVEGKTSKNREKDSVSISFENTNINNGVSIAILLQYGHGTRNGGYVQGRDYINPAIQPLFDQIAEEAWKEVTRV